MRIVITGAGGQLGTDLSRLLARVAGAGPGGPHPGLPAPNLPGPAGMPALTSWQQLSRAELDLTDGVAVRAVVLDQAKAAGGDLVVVNAAAWTDVDGAERHEDEAYAVNATGVGHLAAACAAVQARLVHVSTDYVFGGEVFAGGGFPGEVLAGEGFPGEVAPGDIPRDVPPGDMPGAGRAPYEPGDPTGPRSAYGRTKLAGEQAVAALLPAAGYVVRTAWLYGVTGSNFVKTMIRLEGERDTVDVVDDQQGSPTWSADLAAGLLELVATRPKPGTYHAVNAGSTTWCGLARAVFEELGADPRRVRPTTTDAFPRPARRPAYSVLSTHSWQAAGLRPLRPWRTALQAAMAEIQGMPAAASPAGGAADRPG
jgi:dTDP-4-dehydrorhamnose reductase